MRFILQLRYYYLPAQTNVALAEKMVIVVNRNDPDSLSIGQHYAGQRSIPESRIVHLTAPIKETMSEYANTVANHYECFA